MARVAVALLAAALIGGVAAAGPAPAGTDSAPHLLLVPNDEKGAAALERSGVQRIAAYDEFTLVEAAGDDSERLLEAGASLRDDMRSVGLSGETLDPSLDRPQLGGKGEPIEGPGLALVQYVGPIKDAWLDRLRKTGARIVTYMAENAYLVHGSEGELGAVAALLGSDPAVRAVVEYTAADKLMDGVRRDGTQALAVQTLSGSDGASARLTLASARETQDPAPVGPYRTVYVAADAGDVRALAADPGVVAVLPDRKPELMDEAANQIVAGNVNLGPPRVPSGAGYLAYYNTLGLGSNTYDFAVDVTDGGMSEGTTATTHPDLHAGGSTGNPSRIAYAHNFTPDANGGDCGGHGTINAGIAGGFSNGTGSAGAGAVEDAGGFNYGLGVAPHVRVGGSKIFRCDDSFGLNATLTALTTAAYNASARISNNSWGTNAGGAYDARSQEYDSLVRDAVPATPGNQQMVEVFSAANAGPGANTIGAPSSAKNGITVGASENVRAVGFTDGCGVDDSGANDARDIIGFSSRGPTDDGRLKPDLVAPGTHVVGTKSQNGGYTGNGVCTAVFPTGSSFYNMSSGTSHSSPIVAGMAALVRRWYDLNVGDPPSPAMTKAMLVGATTDSVGGVGVGGNAPNNNQGWGLANLRQTLVSANRRHYDQARVFDESGKQFQRSYTVADTGAPVRVTLAWTDVPGPLAGNSFVNNLDLTVVHGGNTYRGNVFAGGNSATGGVADPANNLESVRLPAGTSGDIQVRVTATNIPGDGVPGNSDPTDQDFALVVANTGPEHPVTDVLLQGSASGERGDADGVLEPGEAFELTSTLENTGGAGASGLSGTLAGAGVSMFRPTAAFPDLGGNTTVANGTPFLGKIPTAHLCGAPVSLTLDVTGSHGTLSDDVVLSTGVPGGPVDTAGSSGLPGAIPDNNAAGATFPVTHPDLGAVTDVNVTIGSLVHSFTGDLRIQLIGPDGTTVTLFDRQGAGGDNLVNTVFDDEATNPLIGATAPFTGSFRPIQSLSALDGKASGGTWQLKVMDLVSSDTGTLQSWSLRSIPATCSSAPTPAAVSFTAAPAEPAPGQQVTLQSTSTDNGPIEEQRWDLDGDGQFDDATGASATTTFGAAGTRQVGLEVVDDRLDTYSASRAIQVGGGGPGAARVTFARGGSVTANAKGVFVFRFTAEPAGERGTAAFATTKAFAAQRRRPRKRKQALGSKSFAVPANGSVTVRVKLKKKHRTLLRKQKSLRTKATVTLGGQKFTRTFTLKAPKPKRRR